MSQGELGKQMPNALQVEAYAMDGPVSSSIGSVMPFSGRIGPLKRAVLALTCATSMVLPNEAPQSAPASPPGFRSEITLPPQNLKECPYVDFDARNAVNKLAAEPQHPSLPDLSVVENIDIPFGRQALDMRQLKKVDWDARAKIAAETGQTLHRPFTYTDQLWAPLDDPYFHNLEAIPFGEYAQAAAEFGANYGITIRTANKADTSLITKRFYPHSTRNEQDGAKQAIVDVIDALGALPEDYVVMSGVKEIVLYDSPASEWAGFAIMGGSRHEIALGIDPTFTGINEDTVYHEFGHHIAAATCGMANVDPLFANAGYAKVTNFKVMGRLDPLYDQRYRAAIQGNYAQLCAIDARIQAAYNKVGAISPYGATAEGENKADMLSELGDGNLYISALSPEAPPPLHERASILLGRMYMASPAVTAFFIRSMIKPREGPGDLFTRACRSNDFSSLGRLLAAIYPQRR